MARLQYIQFSQIVDVVNIKELMRIIDNLYYHLLQQCTYFFVMIIKIHD